MNWLFASLACFSKGMFVFLCRKLLTVKVNRAPEEVHNATGISEGMSSLVHKGGLLEGGDGHLVRFPIRNVTLAQHVDHFLSRIRMEQLMSITQEETESLRRREIACESWGRAGSWEQRGQPSHPPIGHI